MIREFSISTFRAYNGHALVNSQCTGLIARNKKARSRLKTVHAAFSIDARSMALPMGGPCGRASALPVPSFRSINPHVSAHLFLIEEAAVRNRKEGVMP